MKRQTLFSSHDDVCVVQPGPIHYSPDAPLPGLFPPVFDRPSDEARPESGINTCLYATELRVTSRE